MRRIQKPFMRKSTFWKLKYTILSKLRVQRKSVLQAWYSDCSEWAIHWSIVLARIGFVSLYFRLLWYHSSLRGSIDQNTLKQRKFGDKTVKSTQLSLVSVGGLHDFQMFLDRTAHAWSMEGGNICSVSVFFVRVGSQISPRRAKKDSNIPSPEENKISQMPYPRVNKDNQIPPHALSPPPFRRHDIDRCISFIVSESYTNHSSI